jgi:hypothetical protein
MAEAAASSVVETPAQKTAWWEPLAAFVLRAVVGVILFLVVASPAVVIGTLVERLHALGVDPIIISALKPLAYFLFSVDALLFITFIVREAVTAFRDLTGI